MQFLKKLASFREHPPPPELALAQWSRSAAAHLSSLTDGDQAVGAAPAVSFAGREGHHTVHLKRGSMVMLWF